MRRAPLIPALAIPSLFACTGLILFPGCSSKGDSEDSRAPAPVEVASVEVGRIELRRQLSGSLRPSADFYAAPRISGQVRELRVRVSDPVERGEVVVVLDDAELVQSVRQAEANLLVAQANLRAAEARLEIAVKESKRAGKLRERGISSDAQLESAEAERLSAEAGLAVAEAQIARAEAELESSRIELGETRVRAEVALRRQDLIEAQSALVESRLRLARLILPDEFGMGEEEVIPTSEPQFNEPAPLEDIPERVELALLQRPDLREAELRLDQARLETVVTRNGLLPRLDFFLSLGKTGYASSFNESFRNLDGDTYDWTVGGEFNYPIGNRAAKGEQLAARATRDQALQAIRNLRRVIRTDVLLAANEIERTRLQIAATAATVALQKLSVQAEKDRLEFGSGTSLQVAQVQRDLLEAEIEQVRAIVEYRIAQVQLYLAEGTLLERRGITLSLRPMW